MKKKHIERMRRNTMILDKIDFGDFRDRMEKEKHPEEIMKNCIDIKHILDKTRKFLAIKCGNAHLSVQANECMYCTPRETLDDLKKYTSMEIAIFIPGKQFATLKEAKVKGIKELIDTVGYYVTIDEIQYIYGRLCRKYNGRKYNG